MDINTLRSRVGRWQAKLRLAMLLALLGITGLSASLVLAQADPESTATAPQPAITGAASPTATEATVFGEVTGLTGERFGVREMFTQADVVVKSVMVFLVFCSLLTWAILFEKLQRRWPHVAGITGRNEAFRPTPWQQCQR
ncbi:hypothetical protein [Halopseudomonas litoralis]|uniref:hypothetical protein n=1 Tax=Halopseudomonas litoralis TaxID=797277 RepID=UPI000B7F7AAF|nr:hypothetical protein [Halopseudomonas litoralis]